MTLNPGIHGPGSGKKMKDRRNLSEELHGGREEWKDPVQENQEGIEDRASLYVFFKGKISRDFCENSRR